MQYRTDAQGGERQLSTKKLVREFGEKLLGVRYHYDPTKQLRYKTVELVVESARWNPARRSGSGQASGGRPAVLVGVRLEYREEELRCRIKAAGARWIPEQRLWVLPLTVARKLGLTGSSLSSQGEG